MKSWHNFYLILFAVLISSLLPATSYAKSYAEALAQCGGSFRTGAYTETACSVSGTYAQGTFTRYGCNSSQVFTCVDPDLGGGVIDNLSAQACGSCGDNPSGNYSEWTCAPPYVKSTATPAYGEIAGCYLPPVLVCPDGQQLVTDSIGKYCAAKCTSGDLAARDGSCPGFCGDGIVQKDKEECDDGGKNSPTGNCSAKTTTTTGCTLNPIKSPIVALSPALSATVDRVNPVVNSDSSLPLIVRFNNIRSVRYYKYRGVNLGFISPTLDKVVLGSIPVEEGKMSYSIEAVLTNNTAMDGYYNPILYDKSGVPFGSIDPDMIRRVTVHPQCKYLAGNNKDDKLKKYIIAVLTFEESELQRIGEEILQSLKVVEPYKSNSSLFVVRGMSLNTLQNGSESEKHLYNDLVAKINLFSPGVYTIDPFGTRSIIEEQLRTLCSGSDATVLFKEISHTITRSDGSWKVVASRPYQREKFLFIKDEDSIVASSVIPHELGHRFGLADEYVEPIVGNLVTRAKEQGQFLPNCASPDDISVQGSRVQWSNLLSSRGVSGDLASSLTGYGKVAHFTGEPSVCFDGTGTVQRRPKKDCYFATVIAGQQEAFLAVKDKDSCGILQGYRCIAATYHKDINDVGYDCLSQKDGGWRNCEEITPEVNARDSSDIGGCAYVTDNVRPTLFSIMGNNTKLFGVHGYGLVNEKWVCDQLKALMPRTVCPRYSDD